MYLAVNAMLIDITPYTTTEMLKKQLTDLFTKQTGQFQGSEQTEHANKNHSDHMKYTNGCIRK